MKTLMLLFIVAVTQAALPSNFKKCVITDVNANQCILNAAQNGISQLTRAYPELGVPSASPLEVAEITIGKGVAQIIDVVQHYTKCRISGIPELKLTKLNFDLTAKKLLLEADFTKIEQDCWFKVNGKALGQHLESEGESVVTFRNGKMVLDTIWEDSKKDGETYIKFSKTNLKLEPKDVGLHFPGLGEDFNKKLTSNAVPIYKDVQKHYEQKYGEIFQNLANQFFSTLSVKEVFY